MTHNWVWQVFSVSIDQIKFWATDLGFLLKHIEHNIISIQLLSPRRSHVLLYLVQGAHCYPQIELCSTLLGTGWSGLWFSNGHKMGQDDIQLKCSTRFGGEVDFPSGLTAGVHVCVCVHVTRSRHLPWPID